MTFTYTPSDWLVSLLELCLSTACVSSSLAIAAVCVSVIYTASQFRPGE